MRVRFNRQFVGSGDAYDDKNLDEMQEQRKTIW